MELKPANIRYIKLGDKDRWAEQCLEKGEVHFGHDSIPDAICQVGDWDRVFELYTKAGRTAGKARDFTREVREFYSLGADCLWITFTRGHLWWTYAKPEVIWVDGGEGGGCRRRLCVDKWRNTDLKGKSLRFDELSSRLTATAAYRQTLCSIKCEDYLLRRLRGEEEPIVLQAKDAQVKLVETAEAMITNLHWADFESMIDLIFSRTGWQRQGRVGGTQKDIDIDLMEPATGARAFVQVKSRSTQRELDGYIDAWKSTGGYDHMFYVCHSPATDLSATEESDVHIWTRKTLADKAVSVGLFDWLIERSV